MITFKEYLIKDQINFQLKNNLMLCENTFRVGTDNWKNYWLFLKEYREEFELSDFDKELLASDIGLTGLFEEKEVLLDYPFINEYESYSECFQKEQFILQTFRKNRLNINYNGFKTTEAFNINILKEFIK